MIKSRDAKKKLEEARENRQMPKKTMQKSHFGLGRSALFHAKRQRY
jgi:hypothetical protein